MKKVFCILLSATLFAIAALSLTACNLIPRDELLRIYMPGEYIDEEIFEEFSEWYEEETGKKITVELSKFDAVEDIQKAVEQGKSDYDILCPSDYMVEYLLSKNLLQKLDKEIIDISEDGLFKEEYIETTREFDPTLEYSVPYMYGTLGIVYDYSKTGKHLTSWEALFGNEFAGRRSVKKSIHDAYAAACLYNARAQITALDGSAKKAKVQSVFEDYTTATISAAKTTLENAKRGVFVWDTDNVKFDMAANKGDVAVALMWSCDAGYVMNDYEDENGEERSGNRNLWYVVPDDGGNVYIDAFVISKYAANTTAANYFLQFICQKDIAIANSEYAGAISPVAAAYDELYDTYTEDEDGMFDGTPAGWKEMFIETMFPSAETLNRCGVMKDFGSARNEISRMWGNIVA